MYDNAFQHTLLLNRKLSAISASYVLTAFTFLDSYSIVSRQWAFNPAVDEGMSPINSTSDEKA